MTLEVQVNFEDDAGERHFVTSAKTALVAATSPAAPENFATSVTDSGDVTLSWDAPAWDLAGEIGGEQTWGDGGSPITGYVVQWKEASVSWDTEADVSEATVTGTSHTVEGLTVGTDYTTRVIAINAVGRGIPSDEKTVTVTRPASTDATLSALTLSGIDFGTFASGTTSYTGTGRQQHVADDRYSDSERLEGQLCHQARRRDGCGWRSLAQLGQQRHHHRGDR